MKLYVNFQNFDQLSHAFLRESISQSSPIHHFCWIEWDEKLHAAPPDISLVYADDLSWREAVRISNQAPGKWVILVGGRSPQIGLPVVHSAFKWSDLSPFAGIEELTSVVISSNPYPVRFALTMPGSATPLGSLQI